MTKDSGIVASQQGDLDCLCGAYSLVNMMSYLFDGRIKRRPLMRTLLKEFSYEWSLDEWLTLGLDGHQMDYLIENVITTGYYAKHFPLIITHPFRQRKILTHRTIFREMEQFLGHQDNHFSRLILIGTQYHWSLVKSMDEQYLYFHDSGGQPRLRKSRYSLKPGHGHQLFTHCIYFIEREF
ncbi:hypothetical protein [Budvicia aquatica]|uniref:Peptidase C39-like domain-containing protein n=1 Tax=Budvicia aquatica TaxID=82979 RepID=A0A2C6DNU3_9GAMM|nr:hypothetical protein [Budvicia aquatica]PHI32008.1 hypothetical protein CRN84_23135 [Budvicia aquatica]VFS53069.1 Uncharacterised protein [Budvicia aquatica]